MTTRPPRSVAITWALCLGTAACASAPGPGDPAYPYNVVGSYSGRFMIDNQPFDGTLQLRTRAGGRVTGAVRIAAPVEMEGRVEGAIIDDLFRVTVTYRDPSGCSGRIEGIVTVDRGGAVVDGPVTVTDCSGAVGGRMSFRRSMRGS